MRRTSILETAQDYGNVHFFSAYVHQCNIVFIFFILYFFLAGQGRSVFFASVWFVRMENNNCTPNTNDHVLKNILR